MEQIFPLHNSAQCTTTVSLSFATELQLRPDADILLCCGSHIPDKNRWHIHDKQRASKQQI